MTRNSKRELESRLQKVEQRFGGTPDGSTLTDPEKEMLLEALDPPQVERLRELAAHREDRR